MNKNIAEKTEHKVAESSLEIIPDLKVCSICFGAKFIAGDEGGFFCIECQPNSRRGRMVKAGKSRGHYVVR